MCKIITTCILCLTLNTAFAQLEMAESKQWILVGELKTLGAMKAKLEYRTSGTDTLYLLFMKSFRKEREASYFGVNFNGRNDTYHTLYLLLKSFFLDENRKNRDYMKTFTLGTTGVNLQHCRLIGGPGVMFTTKEGYINFSEKDIDKLFGKR
jgi:hypothetical protein